MGRAFRKIAFGFIRGAGKAIDIWNTNRPYRVDLQKGENVRKAWGNVGNSMKRSMLIIEHETSH